MANSKKQDELLKKLTLPEKFIFPKKTLTDEQLEEQQRQIRIIHGIPDEPIQSEKKDNPLPEPSVPKKKKKEEKNERVTRLTLDVGQEMYDQVRFRLMELKITFVGTYIQGLISADLEKSEFVEQAIKLRSKMLKQ